MQAAGSTSSLLDADHARSPGDDPSLSMLLGGIVTDLQQLMEDHLHLLKLELQDDWRKSTHAVVPTAIGWGLILAACMLLLVMLIGWLAWIQPAIPWFGWAGLLAVGFVCLGGIFLLIARRRWTRVNPLPGRTLRQVKRTIQSINNQVNTETP